MATTLTGVQKTDIGQTYDLALAVDNGASAQMYGYVLPAEATWEEGYDLQGSQRLVQISSPNQVDRYDYWPQVSQGDWSGGERQINYGSNSRYYVSNQMETATPGILRPGWGVTTPALPSDFDSHVWPLATDGQFWFVGGRQSSINAAQVLRNGSVFATGGAGSAYAESILVQQQYLFYTFTTGIARVNIADGSGTLIVGSDPVDPNTEPAMAYFAGKLYYGYGGNKIRYAPGTANPGTDVYTINQNESLIRGLTATANGLFFCTRTTQMWGDPTFEPSGGPFQSILYTFDGANATRVGKIPGYVIGANEVNGVLYIHAILTQYAVNAVCTLYALTGNTLSIIDDQRVLPIELVNSGVTNPAFEFRSTLAGDGRFLYVAAPQQPVLRYDLTNNYAVTRVGPRSWSAAPSADTIHRVVSTSLMPAQNLASGSGTASAAVWEVTTARNQTALIRGLNPNTTSATGDGRPNSQTLVTSIYDFGNPNVTKFFRSVSVRGDTRGLSIAFVVDPATGPNGVLSGAPTAMAGSTVVGTQTVFFFPKGTKGGAVQLYITMTNALGYINSYAVKATLGRVWKTTLSCHRNQQVRTGYPGAGDDIQVANAVDLIANLQAIVDNAGRCIAYVPSPKAGPNTIPPYVEQVSCVLQDYSWRLSHGQSPNFVSSSDYQSDIEGDVDVVLAEY